jgi:hypothetical protein
MAARKECIFLPPSISALRLRDARDEREYVDILTELVRLRHHIDTLDFRPPRRPGLLGAIMGRLRMLLWRLLRYQHDRMAFRQNQVNSCLMALIEFQGLELQRLRRHVQQDADARRT